MDRLLLCPPAGVLQGSCECASASAEYETRIRDFAKGCQKISGNAGPFFAPATERRIRNRDRMYRVLGSRPLARFFKKLTEKAATDIKLREYPALSGA